MLYAQVRTWVRERAGFDAAFDITWYPGRYDNAFRSIFAVGDVTQYVPGSQARLIPNPWQPGAQGFCAEHCCGPIVSQLAWIYMALEVLLPACRCGWSAHMLCCSIATYQSALPDARHSLIGLLWSRQRLASQGL